MKKIKNLLASTLCLSALLGTASAATFSDVNPKDWYYDHVNAAVQAGLMSGVGGNTFAPDSPMNYGQFAVVVVNGVYHGETVDKSTDSHWADPYLNCLLQNNLLTTATGEEILPKTAGWQDQVITREAVASIVSRLMEQSEENFLTASGVEGQSAFSDVGLAEENRGQAADIANMLKNNIMIGSEGVFGVGDSMTRAQACVIFPTLLELNVFSDKDDTEEAPEDVTPEDVTPEEETLEDVTPEDETPEDETPEDETPEDETPEGETPEDETPEDVTPEEETPEDETPEEETPEDVAPEDETPEDVTPEVETTTPSTTPSTSTPSTTTPTQTAEEKQAEYVAEVFRLVNEERAKEGLKALIWHDTLMEAAQFKSDEMNDLNYYDHDSPIYGEFNGIIELFNIKWTACGENIARNSTPAAVMNAWMNSTGHRENILSSTFTHIGIGYADGYWTQQFVRS